MSIESPDSGQVLDYDTEALKRRRKLEHYFPVVQWSRDVEATPNITRGGVALAGVLVHKQRHGIVEKISRKRLAECCRVSQRTVQRYLNELYRAGLLSAKRRNDDEGYKVSNGYYLIRTFASDADKCAPKSQTVPKCQNGT